MLMHVQQHNTVIQEQNTSITVHLKIGFSKKQNRRALKYRTYRNTNKTLSADTSLIEFVFFVRFAQFPESKRTGIPKTVQYFLH